MQEPESNIWRSLASFHRRPSIQGEGEKRRGTQAFITGLGLKANPHSLLALICQICMIPRSKEEQPVFFKPKFIVASSTRSDESRRQYDPRLTRERQYFPLQESACLSLSTPSAAVAAAAEDRGCSSM